MVRGLTVGRGSSDSQDDGDGDDDEDGITWDIHLGNLGWPDCNEEGGDYLCKMDETRNLIEGIGDKLALWRPRLRRDVDDCPPPPVTTPSPFAPPEPDAPPTSPPSPPSLPLPRLPPDAASAPTPPGATVDADLIDVQVCALEVSQSGSGQRLISEDRLATTVVAMRLCGRDGCGSTECKAAVGGCCDLGSHPITGYIRFELLLADSSSIGWNVAHLSTANGSATWVNMLSPDGGATTTTTRCGISWSDANRKCATDCVNNVQCPNGETCFTDLSLVPCETGATTTTRCGISWSDANGKCATDCVSNVQCSNGETCFADLSLGPCETGNGGGALSGWRMQVVLRQVSAEPPSLPPAKPASPTEPPVSPPPTQPDMTGNVSISFVIAGAVTSFNEDAFSVSLAQKLGVPKSAVTLTVSAASVLVVALVDTSSVEVRDILDSVDVMRSNLTLVSSYLEVDVENIAAPIFMGASRPSHHPELLPSIPSDPPASPPACPPSTPPLVPPSVPPLVPPSTPPALPMHQPIKFDAVQTAYDAFGNAEYETPFFWEKKDQKYFEKTRLDPTERLLES